MFRLTGCSDDRISDSSISKTEMGDEGDRKLVLSASDIDHKIKRIAAQIIEKYPDGRVGLLGILTRGATVAERVRAILSEEGLSVDFGTLDISLYRDDLNRLDKMPSLEGSDVAFEVDGARVILFDEVLYTGRTVRAAIGGIMDYGRPAKIELAVLVDRGHRELPIQPDYVGEVIETVDGEYVQVRLQEIDGKDGVYVGMVDQGGEGGA